jgi:hypothetical protein
MYAEYKDYMQMYYPDMMNVNPIKYPDIYYMIYPFVVKKCDMMDSLYNPMMYPYPSYEMIEKMTDEIYEECKNTYPNEFKEYEERSETTQRRPRRRGLLRGLIGILLIDEILRRRRRYPYRSYYYY